MKLKYMIPALCICTCTAMPEMLHAQDDSLKKDSTERPFNAMDYVLQKRYIPQGREVNNSPPGQAQPDRQTDIQSPRQPAL